MSDQHNHNLPKPSIGRLVHFYPGSALTAEEIHAASSGNSVRPTEPIAAVIVKVWSDETVNLKLLTDGPIDVWRTSVTLASDPDTAVLDGRTCWAWPPRV